jgi:hypothetical protein
VVSELFDSTMATIRRNIHPSWQQDQRQSMEHTWSARKKESGSPVNQNERHARNPRMQFQNTYSDERRKNERQNEEEDPHWRQQQHCYEKRRFGRRYDEDQWERNQQPRPVRLEFPRFTGKNPNTWLFKANTFFEYYQTPVWDQIPIAAFHMRGEAAIWFGDVET